MQEKTTHYRLEINSPEIVLHVECLSYDCTYDDYVYDVALGVPEREAHNGDDDRHYGGNGSRNQEKRWQRHVDSDDENTTGVLYIGEILLTRTRRESYI